MIDDFINGRLLRFATPDVIDALIETMRETFQEEKFNEFMGLWLHAQFLDPNRNPALVSELRKQGASAPKEHFGSASRRKEKSTMDESWWTAWKRS